MENLVSVLSVGYIVIAVIMFFVLLMMRAKLLLAILGAALWPMTLVNFYVHRNNIW